MTLKISKNELPFKDTPGLRRNIKKACVKLDQIGKAKNETKRFAYLACKAACEAGKIDFPYRFEEFLQFVEPTVIEKSVKLLAEMKAGDKAEAKRKAKAKAEAKAEGEKEKKAKEDAKANNKTTGTGSVSGTGESQGK